MGHLIKFGCGVFLGGTIALSIWLWSQFHDSLHDAPECPPTRAVFEAPEEMLCKSIEALCVAHGLKEAAIERNKAAIDRQAMELEQRR